MVNEPLPGLLLPWWCHGRGGSRRNAEEPRVFIIHNLHAFYAAPPSLCEAGEYGEASGGLEGGGERARKVMAKDATLTLTATHVLCPTLLTAGLGGIYLLPA